MRTLLLAALLAALPVVAAETQRISPAQLVDRIGKQDAGLVIVDVRTPEEFANGHVPGAVNIPYTHMPARLAELASASDKDIVLYCESGVRTERAIARMKANGFTRLLHLDGDMAKWREAKRTLEK